VEGSNLGRCVTHQPKYVGFPACVWQQSVATATCRERMGSPTLQTLQSCKHQSCCVQAFDAAKPSAVLVNALNNKAVDTTGKRGFVPGCGYNTRRALSVPIEFSCMQGCWGSNSWS
jgi:hypothetical protein